MTREKALEIVEWQLHYYLEEKGEAVPEHARERIWEAFQFLTEEGEK
jgi:hypothetical protein